MPIEIKELQIMATVEEPCEKKTGATLGNDMPGSNIEIIEACVEQVLRILEEKKER